MSANSPTSRRRFLRGAGAAGLAAGAALAAGSTRVFAEGESGEATLVGSWVETLTSPADPTSASWFPPFQTLFTYSPGGGLVATASIDATPNLQSGPTHGTWKALRGRRYTFTAHAFSFSPAGDLNGFYNIKEEITLSSSGDAYTATGTFEVVNGPGAVPLTPYRVTAQRISV